MSIADIVGQIFWIGTLATPVFSFLILRKADLSRTSKILFGVVITIFLAIIFMVIALSLIFRNGLGPDSTYGEIKKEMQACISF
jgi:predicted permease